METHTAVVSLQQGEKRTNSVWTSIASSCIFYIKNNNKKHHKIINVVSTLEVGLIDRLEDQGAQEHLEHLIWAQHAATLLIVQQPTCHSQHQLITKGI